MNQQLKNSKHLTNNDKHILLEYDNNERLVHKQVELKNIDVFYEQWKDYLPNGKVYKIKNNLGNEITYFYNNENKIERIVYEFKGEVTNVKKFEYNPNGTLKRYEDIPNIEIIY